MAAIVFRVAIWVAFEGCLHVYDADWIIFMTPGERNKLVIYSDGGQVRAGEYEGYHESALESKSGRFRKHFKGLRGWHVHLISRLSYCLFI